ncbi:hypothetical protein ARMGADRAFT_1028589 [Armillaria gallica]|uniref:Uncharacterized protein n=1 Tax=Armillaria gallica TaxID=47427 RepID=A0A2H3DMW1_ARMGA|nr:hypothetical protein ARMGADRAFT_1028589 [Armillaria gallica]
MSSRRMYSALVGPSAHNSPGMMCMRINNNPPVSRSQSVSVTSELTVSLSELEEQSVSGMASIVLTDSDEELEAFSDAEAFSRRGHAGYHVPPFSPPPRHERKPPSYSYRYGCSTVNHSHGSLSPTSPHSAPASSHHSSTMASSHRSSKASSSHSLPVNAPLSSDRLTRPGIREAVPAILGEPPRVAPSCKQKFYVVTNGRTMGVFTHWYAQFLEDGIDINDAASPTLEDVLERWNECWMNDKVGSKNESGCKGHGGAKGKGQEAVPTFYYIIVKGKVPHVVSSLDNAIADAGTHPYREVFVVRDEFTALKFLADKLHDDEVLWAEF